MEEQTTGIQDITTGTANVTKQIRLITSANKKHSANALATLEKVRAIRHLALRHAADAGAVQRLLENHAPKKAKAARWPSKGRSEKGKARTEIFACAFQKGPKTEPDRPLPICLLMSGASPCSCRRAFQRFSVRLSMSAPGFILNRSDMTCCWKSCNHWPRNAVAIHFWITTTC